MISQNSREFKLKPNSQRQQLAWSWTMITTTAYSSQLPKPMTRSTVRKEHAPECQHALCLPLVLDTGSSGQEWYDGEAYGINCPVW